MPDFGDGREWHVGTVRWWHQSWENPVSATWDEGDADSMTELCVLKDNWNKRVSDGVDPGNVLGKEIAKRKTELGFGATGKSRLGIRPTNRTPRPLRMPITNQKPLEQAGAELAGEVAADGYRMAPGQDLQKYEAQGDRMKQWMRSQGSALGEGDCFSNKAGGAVAKGELLTDRAISDPDLHTTGDPRLHGLAQQ